MQNKVKPVVAAPKWLYETPNETRYHVVMESENGDWEQAIELTRAGYIAVKQYVAAHGDYYLRAEEN